MRILFVAPWIPSKIRPRSYALLHMLAKNHEVRFLGLVSSDEEVRQAQELPVERRALVRRDRLASMVRCVGALPTKVALQQAYADVNGLRVALGEELRQWRPDAVHLNVFRTAHLVEPCAGTPVIVDLDEFRSEYYEQLIETAGVVWRTVGRIEAPRMRRREDALVRMGVPLIVSAPQDPGNERPNTHVVRSPYDYPLGVLPRSPEPVVLFVGRLTYEANVSGLLWFLKECWPGIKRRTPQARLRIVGTQPPRSVLAFEGDGVEVFADVPDVDTHYAEAAVAIVPIHRGTGVQMKLIQALAAGVPTVSTSAVSHRAGVRHGEDVLIADSPVDWVEAVTRLLADGAAARRLAANGRDWAVENHSSDAVERQLATAYAALGLRL
ncbi:glycosyltransferase family 4 protein [Allorhizocola rhizosphaerae]|uniref:glycosyltransferase family 4 protein n=1 Tax=Allorhizocola rhizosphaerae TaxID=1872709 RepID=UPI000E3D661B|nr:glycosyltransferase family 4 protein [Allorhizocola rhizosphaerae]